MLSPPRRPWRTIRSFSSAGCLGPTFSAGFAWLRGTSSPGGKVSLISPPQMIHIRLNPHSVTIRARAARGRGPDDGAGQLRVPPTFEAARSL